VQKEKNEKVKATKIKLKNTKETVQMSFAREYINNETRLFGAYSYALAVAMLYKNTCK